MGLLGLDWGFLGLGLGVFGAGAGGFLGWGWGCGAGALLYTLITVATVYLMMLRLL